MDLKTEIKIREEAEQKGNPRNDKELEDVIIVPIPRMSAYWLQAHLLDYCADKSLTTDAKLKACAIVMEIQKVKNTRNIT